MYVSLQRLFQQAFGFAPEGMLPLPAEGSKRAMIRLVGGSMSAIGVLGPDPGENCAFVAHARRLGAAGLPVPNVLAAEPDASAYLVEDLGDRTLFKALAGWRAEDPTRNLPSAAVPAYHAALERLVQLQLDGDRAIDYGEAYPTAAFDATAMRWDVGAFKNLFLRLGGVAYHEGRFEDDMRRLIEHLLQEEHVGFIHRDFQSRNIMLRAAGDPWFIDFQNGRRGALAYDVASLLFDGKAALAPDTREALLSAYEQRLAERHPAAASSLRERFGGYCLLRVLQAMSAYGYLGFFHRKVHFLESVAHAVRNLQWLVEHEPVLGRLPEMCAIVERVAADERFVRHGPPPSERLVVHIGSFSYRYGYPHDADGHGGGFVFDCRGLNNPGLDPVHAGRSGLDAAVAAVLEASPEAVQFADRALALVATQVETYRRRGWGSLTVQFGCTGGQHRSVWAAERTAAAIVRAQAEAGDPSRPAVVVRHREAVRWPITAARPSQRA